MIWTKFIQSRHLFLWTVYIYIYTDTFIYIYVYISFKDVSHLSFTELPPIFQINTSRNQGQPFYFFTESAIMSYSILSKKLLFKWTVLLSTCSITDWMLCPITTVTIIHLAFFTFFSLWSTYTFFPSHSPFYLYSDIGILNNFIDKSKALFLKVSLILALLFFFYLLSLIIKEAENRLLFSS